MIEEVRAVVLWSLRRPDVAGSCVTASALEDARGRFALAITLRANAQAIAGTYADETDLSQAELVRASDRWRSVCTDEGWVDVDIRCRVTRFRADADGNLIFGDVQEG